MSKGKINIGGLNFFPLPWEEETQNPLRVKLVKLLQG